MPELPEVETIRRSLSDRILETPITSVEVRLPKMVKSGAEALQKTVVGQSIVKLERRGKLLIAHLSLPNTFLLLHLKMTGQLIYRQPDPEHPGSEDQVAGGHPWPNYNTALPNQYTHIIFHFANGGTLFFNDLRQFGFVKLVGGEELEKIRSTYGLEPGTPEFTEQNFVERLGKRRGGLKAVLLNQAIISGLGNIYVDESCFWAGIRPDRRLETLTPAELTKLYEATRQVISDAILHRGTTVHDYVDGEGKRGNYADFLMVYGREGQECLRCHQAEISKIKIVGRGTHFCPNCQS